MSVSSQTTRGAALVPRFIRRTLAAASAAVMLTALSGCGMGAFGFFCAIPRDPQGCEFGDRCYIEDSTFIVADQLYAKLGSLHLVERHLCEIEQLRRCEVNEALYRLKKVHGLP